MANIYCFLLVHLSHFQQRQSVRPLVALLHHGSVRLQA